MPDLRSACFMAFVLLHCLLILRSHALQFSFPDFSPSLAGTDFDLAGSGIINNDALQLTFDSAANDLRIVNSSGRITYRSEQLKLWDPRFNHSASFNTSFLLNMRNITADGIDSTTGGGMAFILSSHTASESVVANSFGRFLGLYNQTTVDAKNSVQRLVAVEFDTFKDSFDPDDNHLGIDLGSPESVKTISLNSYDVFLRTNHTNINSSVWIDYDGSGHQLYVFISAGTHVPKPEKPVLQYGMDLSKHLPESVYLGFTGSTGTLMETHCVLGWNFTSEEFPSPSFGVTTGVVVGLTAAVLVILALTIFVVLRRRQRRKVMSQAWLTLNYGPRKFSYKELSKATNNFSADCKLGEGSFGAVFKGVLDDPPNQIVAVKRMSAKSTQGENEFKAEVTIIGRLRHRNLVQLLGWGQDRKGRPLLVYDYMPNGSLNHWLHGRPSEELGGKRETLGWELRYNIMKGLATGLLYLHEEWELTVVHRDVKPSNVMLDAEYNPRLGDFGLARMIEVGDRQAETRNIAGTPAYMAPECLMKGEITKESDVYSFGIMAMEVATGCRPSFEVRFHLWQLHQENRLSEAADPRLGSFDPAEVERLLLVGLACCHPDAASRPPIRQALHALSVLSSPFAVPPLPPQLSIDPDNDSDTDSDVGSRSLLSRASFTRSHGHTAAAINVESVLSANTVALIK